ncbi:hypothetical protein [Vibrio crassostreae]|uniref:hypothetical protein n=1 Tax=Vibrio crassostreae TaxID=246167 RepID=UPI001B30F8E6|nr:hypothetical protein [Vibrio crassostreae]
MIQSAMADTMDKHQSNHVIRRYTNYAKSVYNVEDKEIPELFDCVWGLASFSDDALEDAFPEHFKGR